MARPGTPPVAVAGLEGRVGGGWSRERGETGTRRGCPGSGPVAGHHTGVTESIDDVSAPVVNRGAPRDAQSAAALARYDRMARLPLVLSALLPLVIAPEPGNPVSVLIGIVSRVVFVVDLVVHERLLRRYLGTRRGVFDLAIVVLTTPWFLLPESMAGGGIVVVLRLARVARLVIASKGARQLFDRLGRVAAVAGVGDGRRGGGGLLRRASGQPGVRDLRRFVVVGDCHPDHGRVWRHRARDHRRPDRRGHDHAHRGCRAGSARRFVGQFLPPAAGRIHGRSDDCRTRPPGRGCRQRRSRSSSTRRRFTA